MLLLPKSPVVTLQMGEKTQAEVNGAVQRHKPGQRGSKKQNLMVGCLGRWTLPLSSPQTPRPTPAEELLEMGGSDSTVMRRERNTQGNSRKERKHPEEVRETINEMQCLVTSVDGLEIIKSKINRVTGKMR